MNSKFALLGKSWWLLLLLPLGGVCFLGKSSEVSHRAEAVEAFQASRFQEARESLLQIASDTAEFERFFGTVLETDSCRSLSNDQWQFLARAVDLPSGLSKRVEVCDRLAVTAYECDLPSIAQQVDAKLLRQCPNHVASLSRTGTVLRVCGCHDEAQELSFQLLKTGAMSLQELAVFAVPGQLCPAEKQLLRHWRLTGEYDVLLKRLTPDSSSPGVFEVNCAPVSVSLGSTIKSVLTTDQPKEASLRHISETCLLAGRFWEAEEWARHTDRLYGENTWTEEIHRMTNLVLAPDTPRRCPQGMALLSQPQDSLDGFTSLGH